MKKDRKRLTLNRETVLQLDDILRSIAGGCNDNSDCPECPGPIRGGSNNSCIMCNDGQDRFRY